jgi:hypothetical protein
MKKAKLVVGTMSKADQAKYFMKYIKTKKFQVTVELLGKTKFAYCDDLSELDDFIKTAKARIIEVTEIKHEKRK